VTIDLTQMQPGHYTANVDVVCENCEILRMIRTCRFDRQHLTLAVDAVETRAVPTVPAPATLAAPRTPRPARSAPTPPASTTPAPSDAQADRAPPAAPDVGPAAPTSEVATVAPAQPADCSAAINTTRTLAIGAGILALGFAAWGASAAQTAARLRAAQN